MDNKSDFVFVNRELISDRLFGDGVAFKLWCWCLFEADPNTGDFVCGKLESSQSLGMAPGKWFKGMLTLKEWGYIRFEPGRQGIKVTLVNKPFFQFPDIASPQKQFTNWKYFSFHEPISILPQSGACYVIFCSGLLQYIGSAENLQTRIKQHKITATNNHWFGTPWGSFGDVEMKFRESKKCGDWLMVEARLIRRLQPPANVVGIRKENRYRREFFVEN